MGPSNAGIGADPHLVARAVIHRWTEVALKLRIVRGGAAELGMWARIDTRDAAEGFRGLACAWFTDKRPGRNSRCGQQGGSDSPKIVAGVDSRPNLRLRP